MNDLDLEILINKDNPLDSDYVPCNLVILDDNKDNFHQYKNPNLKPMIRGDILPNLSKMFEEARKMGFSIIVDSGYRSYDYQLEILNDRILELGLEEAQHMVALPGTSEHQSGLCFDIAYFYDNVFNDDVKEDDNEVKWLIDNSYKYGFILRYPKGKEDVTGYVFEPWHYRYVGKRLAKILYDNNITLEEYYLKKKVYSKRK